MLYVANMSGSIAAIDADYFCDGESCCAMSPGDCFIKERAAGKRSPLTCVLTSAYEYCKIKRGAHDSCWLRK